jgi:hypothetical protein
MSLVSNKNDASQFSDKTIRILYFDFQIARINGNNNRTYRH